MSISSSQASYRGPLTNFSTYAQTTTLTAWMLIHIWSTGDLWAKIKSETSAFAKVKSGPKILAFSGSSSINIEDTGLLSSSPLLLACFNECAKRYLLPHATLRMVKDRAPARPETVEWPGHLNWPLSTSLRILRAPQTPLFFQIHPLTTH